MSCQDFRNKLGPYVYHALIPAGIPFKLAAAEVSAMDEHARHCSACAAIAKSSKTIVCREIVETLLDYLDGAMTPDERARFELHLTVCAPCVEYIESYKQTMALEKRAFEEPANLPQPIPEDLVRAVLAARRKQPPK